MIHRLQSYTVRIACKRCHTLILAESSGEGSTPSGPLIIARKEIFFLNLKKDLYIIDLNVDQYSKFITHSSKSIYKIVKVILCPNI